MSLRILLCLLGLLLLSACATGIPEGLKPVSGFDAVRYMGVWYEAARIDNSFECGLTAVQAEYTLLPDSSVRVVNSGYDPAVGKWRSAKASANFSGPSSEGAFDICFFWPFYGAYNIVALDADAYQWAIVCGYERGYLWLLTREREPSPELLASMVEKAKSLGFDTSKLHFIEHGFQLR